VLWDTNERIQFFFSFEQEFTFLNLNNNKIIQTCTIFKLMSAATCNITFEMRLALRNMKTSRKRDTFWTLSPHMIVQVF